MTTYGQPTTSRLRASSSGVFAVFLGMHGLAHFVGTVGTIDVLRTNGKATLLGGAWHTGHAAVLLPLALLWAALGAWFLGVAYVVGERRAGARRSLAQVSAASLVLCVVNLPAAVAGLVIDAVLLVGVWRYA